MNDGSKVISAGALEQGRREAALALTVLLEQRDWVLPPAVTLPRAETDEKQDPFVVLGAGGRSGWLLPAG